MRPGANQVGSSLIILGSVVLDCLIRNLSICLFFFRQLQNDQQADKSSLQVITSHPLEVRNLYLSQLC